MSAGSVRVGTRGSQLALVQARLVVAAFEQAGEAAEIVVIETAGDWRAPDTAWGEGAFVAAIERALLAGEVDVAVHSAKDVPTDEDPRLRIAAMLERAEPTDALVVRFGDAARSVAELAEGSRVGTDSPRRTGFLLARRPDLRVHPLHGNVDTRLRRLDEGETDALVLATAGLCRLGRDDRIVERLDPSTIPPAPGQGAIAVQVRAEDDRVAALAEAIDHRPTRIAVEAERLFLARSGGGCRAPIGALATIHRDRLRFIGGYALPDGSAVAVEQVEGRIDDREALVEALVDRLSVSVPGVAVRPTGSGHGDRPADDSGSGPRPRVLVTRAASQARSLVAALRERGIDPVPIPTIEIEPAAPADLVRAIRAGIEVGGSIAWVIVTSPNGATAAVAGAARLGDVLGAARWAAVGTATAAVLSAAGIRDVWLPSVARAHAIGEDLPIHVGDAVVVIRAGSGDPALTAALTARGARVAEVVAHRTIEGPATSRDRLHSVLSEGRLDAILFASGSAVRGLMSLAGPTLGERARAIPVVAIGPATAEIAREHGFTVLGESSVQRTDALAERTAELLRAPIGAAR
ncbi:MAG: hydroxymethylbilane synthase [Candidatus Limnocylindrales bacterium]